MGFQRQHFPSKNGRPFSARCHAGRHVLLSNPPGAVAYPWTVWWQLVNSSPVSGKTVGHNDYAVNGGESYTACSCGPNYGYPAPWGEASPVWGCAGPTNILSVVNSQGQMTQATRDTRKRVEAASTGVSYTSSQVRLSDITDGANNTYLAGEKFLGPDYYMTGGDNADNEAALVGHDDDIARWASMSVPTNDPNTWVKPLPDTGGLWGYSGFGSAHDGLQHGLLRRVGPRDELLRQLRDPPTPLQPKRRIVGGWEEPLTRISCQCGASRQPAQVLKKGDRHRTAIVSRGSCPHEFGASRLFQWVVSSTAQSWRKKGDWLRGTSLVWQWERRLCHGACPPFPPECLSS